MKKLIKKLLFLTLLTMMSVNSVVAQSMINTVVPGSDGNLPTPPAFDMETVTIDFSKVTSIGERIEMTKKMGLEGKQVYDLKGRKAGKSAAALKKGIYVIDGKKVIIK